MVNEQKIKEVNELVAKLRKRRNIFLTNYSGIKVKGLSVLRRMLREKNAEYMVVKNNLLKRALAEVGLINIEEHLKGPLGVAFVQDEVGEVAKVLKNFKKDEEKFSFSYSLIDNVLFNESQIKTIADLPPKEVLLAQIMSMINGPASHIAIGINQVIASLARGIKAVAEAQNQQ